MGPKTFGVQFIVRNNRKDKEGYVPIYAKITISNQVLKISLNHRIKPQDWASEKGRPKPSSKSSSIINEAIEAFKSRVYQAYSNIIASNEELTAENLKNAFYGKKKEVVVYSLVNTALEHNKHFESMIGIKYSYGSYKNYKTTLKYLSEFVPLYNKKKDILLKDVNYKFCEAFFTYLTTVYSGDVDHGTGDADHFNC